MNRLEKLKERYNRNNRIKQDLDKGLALKYIRVKYNIKNLHPYLNYKIFNEKQEKLRIKINEVEKMIIEYKSGKTLQEIANSNNLTRQAVYSWIHDLGLTKEDGGYTLKAKNKEEKIIQYLKEHKSFNFIIEHVKVSSTKINEVAIKNNLPLVYTNSWFKEIRKSEAIELYKEGKTRKEIALKLGVTQGTVSNYLLEEFGEIHRVTGDGRDERNETVLSLFEQGCSTKEIAEKMGYTYNNIRVIMKELGLTKARPKREIIGTEQMVIDMYNQGRSYKAIEAKTGYSKYKIDKIAKRNGIFKPRCVARLPKHVYDKVEELCKIGVSKKEIIATLGISLSSYYKIVKARGLLDK